MSPKTNPQLGPALALAQLIQEHPELPPVTWEVRAHGDVHLVGQSYTAVKPFDVLRGYADILGGSILPSPSGDYEAAGRRRRMHELTTVWRGVRVRVRVAADAPLAVPA